MVAFIFLSEVMMTHRRAKLTPGDWIPDDRFAGLLGVKSSPRVRRRSGAPTSLPVDARGLFNRESTLRGTAFAPVPVHSIVD
ncbi:hypothetical protein [Caballeronia glebae]|uniref:hypothetical protein n=1 Tax=Caballeronia glebae TaxID=1777143 RepID=UPI0038B91196